MNTNHHGIVHFEIPASDPEKLSQFYTKLLGWQIQRMDMGGMGYWVTMTVDTDEQGMPKTVGAINGGIYARQAPNQRPVNYANVENIDQYIEKAQSLGATVTVPKGAVPQMGWYAQLTDPDGNDFGLWQNDPSAA
jgi:predicted enzyme related to lactoylglutathione lyase